VSPETEYAEIQGLRIAYQTVGEGPPDVLLSSGHFNNMDAVWEDPGAAVFLRRMAGFCRIIRFDALGSGGSDRPLQSDLMPAYDDQIKVVLDAAGSARAALVTMLDAGPAAIEFAAKHPDRVSHMILWNSTARMLRDVDYPEGLDEDSLRQAYARLAEGWASEEFAALSAPSRSRDPEFLTWYRRYMRSIATPTEVTRVLEASLAQDARPFLADLTMPTLVMHRSDYALVPVSHSRYIANHVDNSEFMEIPGADGAVFWETPDLILEVLERFIVGRTGTRAGKAELTTLLFTDIVRSTEQAEGMGDRNWLAVVDEHNATTRRVVEKHGGRIVKHTGDGTLATFPVPSDAVHSAIELRQALAGMAMEIRTGIHVGEVRRSVDDVEGLAVSIASRVMNEAEPGEILVSRTVRDLTAGSAVVFEHAGTRHLKGLADEWDLFRINP
jgi:class 3 adenylate cyclase